MKLPKDKSNKAEDSAIKIHTLNIGDISSIEEKLNIIINLLGGEKIEQKNNTSSDK